MAVLTAAISFDDANGVAAAAAGRLTSDAAGYPDVVIEQLLDAGFVAAHHIVPRRALESGRLSVSRPDGMTVMVGGPRRSHDEGAHVARELASPGAATSELPYGRWIALRHDPQKRTVRILNDPLGMAWLYLAKVPGGFLLSSDLSALANSVTGELTVDHDAALAQLALGYVPSDATCLNEITMVSPGSVLELTSAGTSVLSVCRPPYGDRFAGISRDEKFEMIDSALGRAVTDWCQGDLDDAVISLSGGHDSPFALAGMLMLGASPKSMTWGKDSSRDVRVPRRLSENLGFPWTHVSAPESSWSSWQRSLQGVGAVGSDWAGWADDWLARLASQATGALTGSAGEALTGKNVRQPDEGPEGDWIGKWQTRGYQDRWNDSPLLRPDARQRFRDATRMHLERQVAGLDVAFPHQRSLQIDLYGRQRRLTGGQTNVMARYLAPLTVFNSPEMVEFWVNIGWADFREQALYLDYAKTRHGNVFDIVLEERDADASRSNAGRRMSRALRLRLAGRFPQLRDRVASTSNDLMGNQLRFKPEIQQLLARVSPLLEPVLDMKAVNEEMERYPRTQLLSPFRLANLIGVAAHVDLAIGEGAMHRAP